MANITIKIVEKLDEIFFKYDWSVNPQPVYIELDCEYGTISAGYIPETGGLTHVSVRDGIVKRFEIPHVKVDTANRLMFDIVSSGLARRVVSGYSNLSYTDDAYEAIDEISDMCHDVMGDLDVWDASDWVSTIVFYAPHYVTLVGYGNISEYTTDDEIFKMAAKIEKDAADDGTILTGTVHYLRSLR